MTIPPLLFALMLWFIGTAAVVWLDSRPQHTFRTSFTLVGWLALIATGAVRLRGNFRDAPRALLGGELRRH